jgi:hypothetical protein
MMVDPMSFDVPNRFCFWEVKLMPTVWKFANPNRIRCTHHTIIPSRIFGFVRRQTLLIKNKNLFFNIKKNYLLLTGS